ncbi:MAG: amidohydrolase [Bacteroidales bacterium]|nr:amidohydrolase [Bacteroidales bacterium]
MLYKNIYIDGVLSDITVEGGVIISIEKASDDRGSQPCTKDYKGQAWVLPGLVNMHTHSAMTLFRSIGSGLPLQRWLNEAIFPCEAKLTSDDIYRGALDACEEMKATGTTTFNDMYFNIDSTIRAAIETGMQAVVSISLTDSDFEGESNTSNARRFFDSYDKLAASLPKNIKIGVAPHSVYAVSGKHLKYIADFAAEHGMPYHIHLSETQTENLNCINEHGMSPVEYLDSLGVLDKTGCRFIGAHALWLSLSDMQLLGEHGATVVHCPNSNLKLGSGSMFPYSELCQAGVNVTLGTDGCASSDNLDMIEAMKVMSLLQKGWRHDPSVLPTDEVLKVATTNGYKALGFDDAVIAEGRKANFTLVDLTKRAFKNMDLDSLDKAERQKLFLNRLIYAANGESVIVP